MSAVKAKEETGIKPWEKPIPFTENFKWADMPATFTAESYTAWMEEALPMIKDMPAIEHTEARTKGIPVGNKIFYLRPFPMYQMFGGFLLNARRGRAGLGVYTGRTEREAKFDDVVNIPVLANKTLSPWMSLTPNEVFTLRGQVRRSKGNVGIAGLGMGWVARKVLERKKVSHVTIYERDQSVIDFFGKSLKEDFGDKVTIVNEDAYNVDWMKHDVALWDIWPGIGDAAWDRKYKEIKKKLERRGKVCCGWTDGDVYRK